MDFIFLEINKAFEKMTGLEKAKIIGKRASEVFSGYSKTDAKYLRIFGEVALENKEVRLERYQRRFGRWYSIYAFSPKRGYFITMSSDITKHRQAEQALKESEEKFRIITTSTPDHILIQDANLYYTTVINPQLGLTEKDMLGKTDFDFLKKKDAVALTKIKKRVLETGQLENVTVPLISLSGETEYFEGSYMPKRGRNGQIDGLIGYFRNVTERMRMESLMKKQKEELQIIIDSVPAMVFYKDKENNFIRTNKALENAMGLTKKEIEGKSVFALYPKKEARAYWKDDLEVMKSGQAKTSIIESMETPGGVRLMQTEKIPYVDEKGDVIGIIGFATDITERKKNEEKIAKLTRLYSILSQVNETIIRARDEKSLLSKTCEIVGNEGNFPLVWIGEAKKHQIVPVAWYGEAAGYLKKIRVEVQGKLGEGPTGTSVREKRPVVNADFIYNSKTSPWRKLALHYGFRASAAFPLCRQGKAIASLTLYASEPKAFDQDQIRLLASLSDNISYALDALDHEQIRKQTEKKIEHLASFPQLNPNPIIETDLSGKIVFVNDGCRRALKKIGPGYKINDFLPKNLEKIIKKLTKNKHGGEEIYEEITLGDISFSERFYLTPAFNTVRIYMHEITKRKIIEEKLVSAQAELKRRVEQQLVDSYQHLGEINRRTSLLLELEKHSGSKIKKTEIANYILSSAIGLAGANIGFLYVSGEKGRFQLISSGGISKNYIKSIKNISYGSLGHIKEALLKKSRVNGTTDHKGIEFSEISKQMSYFVTLPLLKEKKSKGFIHLGFEKIKSMETQELEFLDVFSIHASSALANAKLI